MDPRQLIRCAPGVQSIQVLDERRFVVVARVGVGAIQGNVQFAVKWLDVQAPERARVQSRGKLPGGTVDVKAQLALTEAGGTRTTLRWEADVSLSGLLGFVGTGLIQGFADAAIQHAYACLKANLEEPGSGPSGPGG